MRTIALLTAILFSTPGAFASGVESQTQIDLDPVYPVQCDKVDAHFVNRIDQVHRIFEDSTQASFQFRVAIGSCKDGQFTQEHHISENALVRVNLKRLVLFQDKKSVASSIQVVAEDQALVTLTFDKQTLFNRKELIKYAMDFYPQGQVLPYFKRNGFGEMEFHRPSNMRFPWLITLEKISDKNSALKIEVLQQ